MQTQETPDENILEDQNDKGYNLETMIKKLDSHLLLSFIVQIEIFQFIPQRD